MVRRDRKRSSLPLGGRGRLHELITKVSLVSQIDTVLSTHNLGGHEIVRSTRCCSSTGNTARGQAQREGYGNGRAHKLGGSNRLGSGVSNRIAFTYTSASADRLISAISDPIKKNVDDGFAKMPKERDGVQKLNMQLKRGDWLSQMVLGVPLPGHEGEEIDSTGKYIRTGDFPNIDVDFPPS
jgi:hypothetical protein